MGVIVVGSSRPEPLPTETESRIGAFTELVATAIANAAARAELGRDAAEVAGLLGVPMAALFATRGKGAATVIAGALKISSYLGRTWPCPAGDPGLVASLQRTGQPCRIEITSATTGPARELGIGMAAGVPVIVSGRVWGAVVAVGSEHPPLPADTLDRLAALWPQRSPTATHGPRSSGSPRNRRRCGG